LFGLITKEGNLMTQVQSGDTVVVHYTSRLDDGGVFETSEGREPLLLTIGQGKTIPALEEAIVGMEPGESKTLKIVAAEAYGPYHKELVKTVSRRALAKGLEPKVGQRLVATRMDGRKDSVIISDLSEKSVTLDANHPLAGKDLTFDIQLVEIV
jgi:peptidylprolyl isomerase